jgi:hypothetical protein
VRSPSFLRGGQGNETPTYLQQNKTLKKHGSLAMIENKVTIKRNNLLVLIPVVDN